MTITIPLNLLQISPLNARKTPPRATEQAELAASIVAHGLLENLIVRPTDTDRYEVLAGGRRLMAMQILVSEGRLEADHAVACLVHDGDPQEVSLAENVVRLSVSSLRMLCHLGALVPCQRFTQVLWKRLNGFGDGPPNSFSPMPGKRGAVLFAMARAVAGYWWQMHQEGEAC